MSSDKQQLPTFWVSTTLGEVVNPDRPRHNPQDYGELPFVGMEHIEAHTMKLLGTVPAESMKSSAVHFGPGDVLYGRLRPYLNKVYCPNFEGLCSAEFIVFPSSGGLSSKYLQFFLNSSEFVSFAAHLNEGDRPRVDFLQISSCPFPLPPLPEQHRIAAELDKQLTRLDASTESLRRAQAKLRLYRSAVLRAACEGRLVPTEAELARAEGRKYESADQLLDRISRKKEGGEGARRQMPTAGGASTPPLPEGWSWITWRHIGFCQNGRAFPSSEYRPDGVKLLRPGNLDIGGIVVWNGNNTRRLSESWAERYPDYLVGAGELVINLTAQSLKDEFLGRVCMTGEGERCLLNQRIARLTPVEVLPRYLLWLFKSPIFRRFVGELNTGSLIQHMFTSQVDEFCLPLPPLAEQKRIADEVDKKLSVLVAVSEAIEIQLKRAEMLRNALLESAFEGNLVPQDHSDEPAAVLLERIRKNREATGGPRPRRGRGIKPGVLTPGPTPPNDPKPRRGAGSDPESASAPSGLLGDLNDDFLGLKPQALRPGPVGAETSDGDSSALLDLSGDQQTRVIWEHLVGMGPLYRDDAIRTVAGFLRYRGLVASDYLRNGSVLWHVIANAIDFGVKKGLFDRPRRGEVRALLPDARDYSLELWSLCLLVSMGFGTIDEDQALRAAAEEARKRMGLRFERLRSDGVILQGLREALEDEVRQGHLRRQGGKVWLTPVEELEKLMNSEREPQIP